MEFRYGVHADQFIRLYAPSADSASPAAVAVLVHGGFFKHKYTVDNSGIHLLVPTLLMSGLAVCLVEYRRVGAGDVGEGGFPRSNDDVIAALNLLSSISAAHHIDATRVVLIGHSAGGTLALWCCCMVNVTKLVHKPLLCVALAPIGDLCEGQRRRLSDEGDAIARFVGVNPDVGVHSDSYGAASPHHLLPLAVPTLLVSGQRDTDVPPDLVMAFYEQVTLHGGSTCTLLALDADHFDLITSSSDAWRAISSAVADVLTPSPCPPVMP